MKPPLPSPIPSKELNSSPLTHLAPLSLQWLELGRKEEEIAFAFCGPFSSWGLCLSTFYAPHWSIHLTTECLTECQELCLSLGVSKGVRQLLPSKSLLSKGNEDTREGCNNLCSNWVPSPSLEGGCLVSSVMSDSLQPMDCSVPGFSVHGILQARILEWVAMPSSSVLFINA